MLKILMPAEPASHPDIIEALRSALDKAHSTPLEHISIQMKLADRAFCTIEAYPGEK